MCDLKRNDDSRNGVLRVLINDPRVDLNVMIKFEKTAKTRIRERYPTVLHDCAKTNNLEMAKLFLSAKCEKTGKLRLSPKTILY